VNPAPDLSIYKENRLFSRLEGEHGNSRDSDC
jgi:hypothetical protein